LQTLKPGDIFIDLDAHMGFVSVLAGVVVSEAGRVVAFEPIKENHSHLTCHIKENNLSWVTPVYAQLAGAYGEIAAHFNPDNDGEHALWDPGQH
tara:strand:+ start:529 stop:810 length:282 start_codon:yes stop_codon:yes gene_type:complete